MKVAIPAQDKTGGMPMLLDLEQNVSWYIYPNGPLPSIHSAKTWLTILRLNPDLCVDQGL